MKSPSCDYDGRIVLPALSVKDAAARLGVSERRVRAMLEDGQLEGRKVGGRWLVDFQADSVAAREKLPIKPLSERSSWALIVSITVAHSPRSDCSVPIDLEIKPIEKHRLKARIDRLAKAEDPVPLLRSWFPKRAVRRKYHVNPSDLADLRRDKRISLSGVSHPASGLLAGNEVEAYVRADEAAALSDDYLLVEPRPDSPANVLLHIIDPKHKVSDQERELPLMAVAADLAERSGAREEEAARNLVRRALADSAS